MTLSAFKELIAALVRDDATVLKGADVTQAIEQTLQRYSQDAPRLISADVGCNGYSAPLPANWQQSVSKLTGVVALSGGETPGVAQLRNPAGDELQLDRFFDGLLRLQFSVSHVLDEEISTVFYGDMEALACYASAICCDQLATYYISETGSSLGVDTVSYQSKSGEYRKQAAAYRKRYSDHVGQKTPGSTAAGAVVSWGSRRGR